MTGLDLESFLQLLRADLGAWASLGLVVVVLGLMTWTSWGSRRALRKCLVLSIAAHVGLVLYGSTYPIVRAVLRDEPAGPAEVPEVLVQLADPDGSQPPPPGEAKGPDGRPSRAVAVWDRAGDAARLAEPTIKPRDETEPRPKAPETARAPLVAIAPEAVAPEVNLPATSPDRSLAVAPGPDLTAPAVAPGDASDVAAIAPRAAEAAPAEAIGTAGRVRPDRSTDPGPSPVEAVRRDAPAPGLAAPVLDLPVETGPGLTSGRLNPGRESPTAEVARAGPGEVVSAAPGPRPVEAGPSEGAILGETGRRPRPDRTGAAPLAGLEPRRSSSPLAPASTTPAPAPMGDQGVGARATPAASESRPAGPIGAPTSVESDPTTGGPDGPVAARPTAAPAPRETLPEADLRRGSRPGREVGLIARNDRRPETGIPTPLPRVLPEGMPGLPAIAGASGLTRPSGDVPAVYRSRLDPNRSALARRAGASRESEQAVERALDWLARHQDPDGRWDGGTAKKDGVPYGAGEDDYTTHCPPGDVCFGECYYWEADTAVTGLSLLAYLGAGYTHLDGRHADTVARGLEYLRLAQKPDGDLRGRSQAVGMYCHAMATLALCEAYALTGDPKLRASVERAVAFLVRSRARDGLAWRYAPGAPFGDTSILGWAVMVLKSAQEVGQPISPDIKAGVTAWLAKVASGPSGGLARYLPGQEVTPTMTAEAWVCRQFLGDGGPGARSDEAAAFLLKNTPGRVEYNLYYYYYGTLAMYQHGGDAWSRWNAEVRDRIVGRQRTSGHALGSWDPDDSKYGTHGGRISCTALATLSLEVYYRYLRLYETPATTPLPSARATDPGLRRTADAAPPPRP